MTAYYRARVALVQYSAELYNGTVETGEGSGFLIGDSTVITDSHVIPRLHDYRAVTITVRLGERSNQAIAATFVARDAATDLAVLRLSAQQSVAGSPCPIETFSKKDSVPLGADLIVLGYPVGKVFSVTDGVLSNQGEDLRWQTNATMNVGNSGGPIFDMDGYLVGFAVSGMTWFGDGDNGTFVSGVNFLVPIGAVMTSQVAALISSPPPCWILADASPAPDNQANQPGQAPLVAATVAADVVSQAAITSTHFSIAKYAQDSGAISDLAQTAEPSAPPYPPAPAPAPAPNTSAASHNDDELALPARLPLEVPISWTKDDHGWQTSKRTYEQPIKADPGYRIESCTFVAQSANHAGATGCVVAPDGQSARFVTKLASGPMWDRWRGWWHGQVLVEQVMREP